MPDLPDWHANFTAVIDVNQATIHARGRLDLFTVELLRGAIAHLALSHPPRITVDLAEAVGIDRSAARYLTDWQHHGAIETAIPIALVNANPAAAALLAADTRAPASEPTHPRDEPLTPTGSPSRRTPPNAASQQRHTPHPGATARQLARRSTTTPPSHRPPHPY